MSKVLVVAAHSDDEFLGTGGIAVKHTNNKDEVRSVIISEGESLRYGKDVGQCKATHKAAQILGVKQVYSLSFTDQKLDTFSLTDIIAPLEKISGEYMPDIIYCQSASDANRDHKILFKAANIAFRPTDSWIKSFYSSTEWGARNFIPDTWVDISDTIENKIRAFECYYSETKPYPHPRSSEALRHQGHF